LDTINRTYRNIDIAIDQQVHHVANLTSRMTKVDLDAALRMPVTRDKRLPDTVSKRPFNVTPHVAVSTAAALNAERSAQKLKRALLIACEQPHLNVKAASAPAAPVAFNTPQRPRPEMPSPIAMTGSNSFAIKNELQPLAWNDSDLLSSSSSSLPARRSAGAGFKHHMKPVVLRRNNPAGQSPPATNFDWGPLPTVIPMTTISADVRSKNGNLGQQSS
jgi:nucleoporin NUP159